jgi:NitT/TauT family transport system permease protein
MAVVDADARTRVTEPSGSAPIATSPVSPRAPGRYRPGVAQVVSPAVLLGLVIAGWYLVHAQLSDRKKFLLPEPHVIIDHGFVDGAVRADIFEALRNTTKVSLIGLLIAIGLGVLFATLMSLAGWVERSFFPWAIVLQTVPILAMVPLMSAWFGYNVKSRIIVCVLIALFPIITNTLFGLLSTDETHHDLFTLHRASWWTRLRKLQFPGALPSMFTGFRVSAGLAVVGAIVGEFFFRRGDKGLGHLIEKYQKTNTGDTPKLWATVVVACLLGIVVFVVFGLLQRLFTSRWNETGQPGE